jgi:phage/plasmid-like protein (TIGR03299 family)
MAHMIEATDSMMYSRTMKGGIPWHGLGNPVPGNLTSDAAIQASGLGWDVRTQHVYIRDMRTATNGQRSAIEVPGVLATVRSDTSGVLGMVTPSYQIIQNRAAFETLEQAIGDLAMWHTAGSLENGKRIWALAEIPGEFKVAGTAHRRFVLATLGHDGEHSGRFLPTDVTVVCNNTLTQALGSDAGFTVTHRGDVQAKLATVTDAFKATFQTFDAMKATQEKLADVRVSHQESIDFVRTVLLNGRTDEDGKPANLGPRDQTCLDTIIQLSEHGKGSDLWRGTALGILQGTTDYVDHSRMQDVTPERRFLYQTEGAGSRLKARMQATLVREYASASEASQASNAALLDGILS